MCPSVIWTGNCPESLMTSCVPNLKLNLVTIQRKWLKSEINSDCCEKYLTELIISVSDNDGGLANTWVSWDKKIRYRQVQLWKGNGIRFDWWSWIWLKRFWNYNLSSLKLKFCILCIKAIVLIKINVWFT